MLLTSIPNDIIHGIFLLLNDRKTLTALVSTSRPLYENFKANPNSILRQVICNEIGMHVQVFPYALASIKCQGDVDIPKESMHSDQEIQPQDWFTVLITPRSFKVLRQSHDMVYEMAKQYSMRFKEGRILRDTLAADETRRFHIAAYLFTHYQALWRSYQGYGLKDSDTEDSTNENDVDEAVILQDAKTISVCHSFLSNVTTDKLFWLQEFRDFLLHDIDYVFGFKDDPGVFASFHFNKYSIGWSDTFCRHFLLSISVGYFGRWNQVRMISVYFPTHLQRTELWLTDAISCVLQERGVGENAKLDKASRILSSNGVLIPACQKCGNEQRYTFLNKTNVEQIAERWSPYAFPDGLSLNHVETNRAYKRVYGSANIEQPSIQMRIAVIHEIIEHAEAKAEEKRSDSINSEGTNSRTKYHKWNMDDVLCYKCFRPMFSALYYAWWLEERQTDRVEARNFSGGTCWWGTECEFQQRYDHAAVRDHCCPRTKDVIS